MRLKWQPELKVKNEIFRNTVEKFKSTGGDTRIQVHVKLKAARSREQNVNAETSGFDAHQV